MKSFYCISIYHVCTITNSNNEIDDARNSIKFNLNQFNSNLEICGKQEEEEEDNQNWKQ